MKKLLFYANSKEEFDWFEPARDVLEEEGYEVAVATDNKLLLEYLSAHKRFLIVTPDSYFEDFFVVQNHKPSWNEEAMVWEEFLECL